VTGLHAGVLDALGRRIVDGGLAPGTVLTLARIESEFGVSRTVARETMRLLESMGLVSSRRRVGITVNSPADWNVLDHRLIRWRLQGHRREEQLRSLTELRLAVEPLSAALAAERADDEDRQRLVDLATRLQELGAQGLGRSEDYLRADIAFHTLLLSASGNEMIAALGDVIGEVLVGRTKLGMMPERPVHVSQRGHLALARAVASADADAAEREALALLSEVRSRLGQPDERPSGS
jgi:DNA-binding FadR family transcriptional regulator